MGKTRKITAIGVSLALLAGCASGYDAYKKHTERYNEEQKASQLEMITNSMDIVYAHRTDTIVPKDDKGPTTYEQEGTGFVVGKKYITLDHVTSKYEVKTVLGPGMTFYMGINRNKIKETTYIDGVALKSIVEDPKTDVAIFDLSKSPDLCKRICNEGIETDTDIYIGMPIYWIGNPDMGGRTFRYGKISRLDIPPNAKKERYADGFGINTYTIAGSSGSPVFNTKGQLIGVIQALNNGIGYVKPIKDFLQYMGKPMSK